jgi:ribosomal protein S18 acetylase RimI-like enzyme
MAKKPLVAIPVDLDDPIFDAIKMWQFQDEFVQRMLTDDIPQRVRLENARIWAYEDEQRNVIGFGTLTLCRHYSDLTNGQNHLYIPLLAVHPDAQGNGYGTAIVEHLINQSADVYIATDEQGNLSNVLFLDVYELSIAAIGLYKKCGFVTLGGQTFADPLNAKGYFVMAKRISI